MNRGQKGFEGEKEIKWKAWRENKRRNKEEMKKQFLGKEKNGTMG